MEGHWRMNNCRFDCSSLRYRSLAIEVCAILLFLGLLLSHAAEPFASNQPASGRGRFSGRGGNRNGSPRENARLQAGRVNRIDTSTLTLDTLDGKQLEFAIGRTTRVRKEVRISKKDLATGEKVLIRGQHVQGGDFVAVTVTVQAAGLSGGRMPAFMSRQVVQGLIKTADPLTVEDAQGNVVRVEITERTTCRRESLARLSDVTPGMTVAVAQPPGQRGIGGRDSGGLEIVIRSGSAVPDRQPVPVTKTDESVLLPDLPQQPLTQEFIYAAWLGRGLFKNEELDRGFRVARNLGIRHLKVEFKWGMIELRNNKWNWRNEGKIDVGHVVTLARKYNLAIIPYFDVFMPWGERREPPEEKGALNRPRGGQNQAPDPKEYAEYVFTVVDLLRTSGVEVRYIELDNEVSAKNDGHNCWNLFINITAKELKLAQNAAYSRVKAKYPEIMISSTTFQSPTWPIHLPADKVEQCNERLNLFVKAYFEEKPRPKFDFLALHEIFEGSGNPYTSWKWKGAQVDDHAFSSYHDIYDIWRNILDRYGYKRTPIFVTEGAVKYPVKQGAVLAQKLLFARTQARKNNVMGWVLSQITASERFAEGRHLKDQAEDTRNRRPGMSEGRPGTSGGRPGTSGGRPGMSGGRPGTSGERSSGQQRNLLGLASPKDIANVADGYALREGYYAWRTVVTILARYPVYVGKIRGKVNSDAPWIEKFRDNAGGELYVAFLPYKEGEERTQRTNLPTGKQKCTVTITTSQGKSKIVKTNANGELELQVSEHPLFLEVRTDKGFSEGRNQPGR